MLAVDTAAVDYLVTDDRQLRARARRAGLAENVLPWPKLCSSCGTCPRAPSDHRRPSSRSCRTSSTRTIRSSSLARGSPRLRHLVRQRAKGAPAWLEIRHDDGRYAGVMLVKDETDRPYGLRGKVLTLFMFKVTDEAHGAGTANCSRRCSTTPSTTGHDAIYITVFDKHTTLIDLLSAFGFRVHDRSPLGERGLAKHRRPADGGR